MNVEDQLRAELEAMAQDNQRLRLQRADLNKQHQELEKYAGELSMKLNEQTLAREQTDAAMKCDGETSGDNSGGVAALTSTLNQFMQTLIHSRQADSNQASNVNMVADPRSVIREFEGTGGPILAKAWLREVSMAQQIHQWTDPLTLSIAMAHLKGPAFNWLLANQTELVSFEHFKTKFNEMFTVRETIAQRAKRMIERVQSQREPLEQYYHHKVLLCKDLNMTIEETKEELAAGVWSKDLCNHILAKEFDTVAEIYQEMLRYERTDNMRRSRIVGAKSEQKQQIRPATASSGVAVPAGSSAAAGSSRAAGTSGAEVTRGPSMNNDTTLWKCFNCNQLGHLSRDCDKPKKIVKCYNCEGVGHIASRCDQPKANLSPSVNTIV